MDMQDLGVKLGRLSKTRLKLIELIECFNLFDTAKARKLADKKAMIESLITQYKAKFDGAFGDIQAKKTAFNQNTDKAFAGDYRKMPFEESIKYYAEFMREKLSYGITETAFNCGINLDNLTRVKKYAFKCAFYQLKENSAGFIQTLESYEKLKADNKKRMEGKTRSNSRKIYSHKNEGNAD